ncbi:HSP20-like chaperone [Suillus bovinus]|uniref:HSP20-like chaperone n=1 Tax=Suillus bovinus TaxID=48563 RepID=UPI001B86D945|nr:HSP20-like chaperone [Suillus bovinus]KAG2159402.1 HSP20-like chaperone [Suillus bovinus]
MTVTTNTSTQRKLAHSQNTDERFQALDRALARRYVLRLLHERRSRSVHEQPQADVVFRPRVEICDDPSSSRITAALELPGMRADDVRVSLERDNLLAISGERVSKAPSNHSASIRFPVREIKYGKFLRTLDVPSGTMMSTISAAMSDGMLLVSWPRSPPGASTRSPQ